MGIIDKIRSKFKRQSQDNSVENTTEFPSKVALEAPDFLYGNPVGEAVLDLHRNGHLNDLHFRSFAFDGNTLYFYSLRKEDVEIGELTLLAVCAKWNISVHVEVEYIDVTTMGDSSSHYLSQYTLVFTPE